MASQNAQKYTSLSRILHWPNAILVFGALFVGFVMVNWPPDYATLLTLHKVLGALVLVVVVLRVINRITHRAPALHETVGRWERVMVFGSELTMYVLLLVQPLIGWAMVSASGTPVVIGGVLRLPPHRPGQPDGVFDTARVTFGDGLSPGRRHRRPCLRGAAALDHSR